jgi:hypothetical protein|tara:strand:- start:395 stop:982 length:588 start_codon:yes stop_codon:yes gene_type:complete
MSLEERTDFGPRFSGSFPEKRLKEIYGEEKYNKNLDAARQAQLQKVGNFLGSFVTNIPGFVGLKGVFPSTAIARDAEVANPQPYIVNDSGNVISNPALGVAETYNQEYDNFLNNYLTEDHSLAPNPENASITPTNKGNFFTNLFGIGENKTSLGEEAWKEATANSPAAASGAFTDDQRWQQQLKHRQWLADNNRL